MKKFLAITLCLCVLLLNGCGKADMMMEKPVIYLYPTQETEVSVKLSNAEDLTCTYPNYNNGWNVNAKPDITPPPDSILRVFMAYKPLNNPVEVKEQKLQSFQRKGFTVVEWGGGEIK